MSSYLSNILTNTTSKYNTLRRNLLNDEVDGDTEDDSHICRALRAYYTEKHSGLPSWLPPDPRRSASQTVTTSSFTSSLRQPSSASVNQVAAGAGGAGVTPARGGGLSELWEPAGQRAQSPQPMSLRRQAQERGGSYQGRAQQDGAGLAPRPLPSQRAGSYQSGGAVQQEVSPPGSSGGVGGGTAQERLKARLWGARSQSPAGGGAATGGSTGSAGSGRFAR